MNIGDWIFPIVVALGGSTVLQAAINAFSGRRKVDADATSVLSQNAMTQVTQMHADLSAARDDIRKFREALYEHQKWDLMVYREVTATGKDIVPPPELWI